MGGKKDHKKADKKDKKKKEKEDDKKESLKIEKDGKKGKGGKGKKLWVSLASDAQPYICENRHARCFARSVIGVVQIYFIVHDVSSREKMATGDWSAGSTRYLVTK